MTLWWGFWHHLIFLCNFLYFEEVLGQVGIYLNARDMFLLLNLFPMVEIENEIGVKSGILMLLAHIIFKSRKVLLYANFNETSAHNLEADMA